MIAIKLFQLWGILLLMMNYIIQELSILKKKYLSKKVNFDILNKKVNIMIYKKANKINN